MGHGDRTRQARRQGSSARGLILTSWQHGSRVLTGVKNVGLRQASPDEENRMQHLPLKMKADRCATVQEPAILHVFTVNYELNCNACCPCFVVVFDNRAGRVADCVIMMNEAKISAGGKDVFTSR